MFNGLAKLLSVGFIGSIDRRAERGSANGSKSSQQWVDPGDVDATGASKQSYVQGDQHLIVFEVFS